MSIIKEPWFNAIQRPSRYLGNEVNAVIKDPATIDVSFALAFPDVYEVGMSHLGLKILYNILNRCEWISAERIFCPWVDLEKELSKRRIPLTTCESRRPLAMFDIVGFSLQHELSYTNVLTMLDLSKILVRSDQRDDLFPLIIAGGPACFNPEPVAPFFDAIVIGDGEEVALQICRIVREAKRCHVGEKEIILTELAKIRGIYVPGFFDVHYNSTGTIHEIEALKTGYHAIEKAIITDLDKVPFPSRQVIPYPELIHDRLAIEIMRGCTRGCRFCQAGMIYRPVRERHPDVLMGIAREALLSTGFEELSLMSLSTGDYSCISSLLKALMDQHAKDKTAVSLPSLRVDSMDPIWFEQIKRVRKTGFTLAPETGSDRLRAVINKNLTNTEIINVAREVYGAGWNLIKLYFMIGLPGEREEDLLEIVQLAKAVSELAPQGRKRAKLNVSLSTFVPKPHTPFMWSAQISLAESRRRIEYVKHALRSGRIRVKWNQPEISSIEGSFSRGDRRLADVIQQAWHMGARFDSWGEHFRLDTWLEAFKRCGLDPEFYSGRVRSEDEILPWDHIRTGVKKGYLKQELDNALHNRATPDCREGCLDCGVCDHRRVTPVITGDWSPLATGSDKEPEQLEPTIKKYRLTFSKTGQAKYISHLELNRLFIRAFRRAGWKLVYSRGYHPLPKISFLSALPVGTESLNEILDFQSYDDLAVAEGIARLNQELPADIRIITLADISLEKKRPKIIENHYVIGLNGFHIKQSALDAFLEADSFIIRKKGKAGEKSVDARTLVKSMNLISSSDLSLTIAQSNGPNLKPVDIIREVLQLKDDQILDIKILRTKQVLG